MRSYNNRNPLQNVFHMRGSQPTSTREQRRHGPDLHPDLDITWPDPSDPIARVTNTDLEYFERAVRDAWNGASAIAREGAASFTAALEASGMSSRELARGLESMSRTLRQIPEPPAQLLNGHARMRAAGLASIDPGVIRGDLFAGMRISEYPVVVLDSMAPMSRGDYLDALQQARIRQRLHDLDQQLLAEMTGTSFTSTKPVKHPDAGKVIAKPKRTLFGDRVEDVRQEDGSVARRLVKPKTESSS